jgi:hypothetical protein
MAHCLPVELWTQIALHLKDEVSSLPIYARVCRQWQPVFERLIYRKLKVESQEGSQMAVPVSHVCVDPVESQNPSDQEITSSKKILAGLVPALITVSPVYWPCKRVSFVRLSDL